VCESVTVEVLLAATAGLVVLVEVPLDVARADVDELHAAARTEPAAKAAIKAPI
jgi:hypothetical protein